MPPPGARWQPSGFAAQREARRQERAAMEDDEDLLGSGLMLPKRHRSGDERRVDVDGKAYSREEFSAFYGTDDLWHSSPVVGTKPEHSHARIPPPLQPVASVEGIDDELFAWEPRGEGDAQLASTEAKPSVLASTGGAFFFAVRSPTGSIGRIGQWTITPVPDASPGGSLSPQGRRPGNVFPRCYSSPTQRNASRHFHRAAAPPRRERRASAPPMPTFQRRAVSGKGGCKSGHRGAPNECLTGCCGWWWSTLRHFLTRTQPQQRPDAEALGKAF